MEAVDPKKADSFCSENKQYLKVDPEEVSYKSIGDAVQSPRDIKLEFGGPSSNAKGEI